MRPMVMASAFMMMWGCTDIQRQEHLLNRVAAVDKLEEHCEPVVNTGLVAKPIHQDGSRHEYADFVWLKFTD